MSSLYEYAPVETTEEQEYISLSYLIAMAASGSDETNKILGGYEHNDQYTQAVQLVRLGDYVALSDDIDDEDIDPWQCYEFAVRTHMDGVVQMALGRALVLRANPTEEPICEQDFMEPDDWSTLMDIDQAMAAEAKAIFASGPDRERIVRLALKAYGSALCFFTFSGMPLYEALILDGLRVCYEELLEADKLRALCEMVPEWIREEREGWERTGQDVPRQLDEAFQETLNRFAFARGRLQPMFVGMGAAEQKLVKELGDSLYDFHEDARQNVVVAEYKLDNLRDPRMPASDFAYPYFQALEACLYDRLGKPMDLLREADRTSSAMIALDEWLKQSSKKPKGSLRDMGFGDWPHLLKNQVFKNVAPVVGLDHMYILTELPDKLADLAPIRNRVMHDKPPPITMDDVKNTRQQTLDVLTELAKIRWFIREAE